jgi:hypothetical protein
MHLVKVFHKVWQQASAVSISRLLVLADRRMVIKHLVFLWDWAWHQMKQVE